MKEDPRISDDPSKLLHFSDESLMRLYLNSSPAPCQYIRRDALFPLDIQLHWIDRSWFMIDEEKLRLGFYTEANLPRPFDPLVCDPILRYLGIHNSYNFIV